MKAIQINENLINRYDFNTGSIFEFDSSQNCYVHIGKSVQYTAKERRCMMRELVDKNTHKIDWSI